jgi:hypothetical protein
MQVRPLDITEETLTPANTRGYNYFASPYSNTAIISKKCSGKTTVLFRAMEHLIAKGQTVYIFSSTFAMDPVMIEMIKMLRNHGVNVIARPSFIDEETGVNYINLFLDQKTEEAQERDAEDNNINTQLDDEPKSVFSGLFSEDNGDLKPKKKKKFKQHLKRHTPKNIIIVDDNSHITRDPSIFKLMQKNRHFSCKVFVLCHFLTCLSPNSINQLDYTLVFGGMADHRIKELNDKLGLTDKRDTKSVPYLQKLYDEATLHRYSFLKIDTQTNKYWKNFDKQID